MKNDTYTHHYDFKDIKIEKGNNSSNFNNYVLFEHDNIFKKINLGLGSTMKFNNPKIGSSLGHFRIICSNDDKLRAMENATFNFKNFYLNIFSNYYFKDLWNIKNKSLSIGYKNCKIELENELKFEDNQHMFGFKLDHHSLRGLVHFKDANLFVELKNDFNEKIFSIGLNKKIKCLDVKLKKTFNKSFNIYVKKNFKNYDLGLGLFNNIEDKFDVSNLNLGIDVKYNC